MPRTEEAFLAAGLPAEFWDPDSPVRFDAQQGTWHVFSYADVELVTHATDRFSHHRGDPPGGCRFEAELCGAARIR